MSARTISRLPSRPRGTRSGAMTTIIRNDQQIRTFRFGWLWSSQHDSAHNRELCQRQRHLRYKYAEGRTSWEKFPSAEESKAAFKRGLRDGWRQPGMRPNSRYVKDVGDRWSDLSSPLRPGRNIEDVERGAMEYLIFGGKAKTSPDVYRRFNGVFEYDHSRSPVQNWIDYATSSRFRVADKASPSSFTRARTSDPLASSREIATQFNDQDYVIDPITNRKVFKSTAQAVMSSDDLPNSSSTHPFKTQGSRLAPYKAPPPAQPSSGMDEPIFYDGPPPEAELKVYEQVNIDPKPWDSKQSQAAIVESMRTVDTKHQDNVPYESVDHVKDLGSNPPTKPATENDDSVRVWRSKGVFWARSHGAIPAPADTTRGGRADIDRLFSFWSVPQESKSAKEYKDVQKYKSVTKPEPQMKADNIKHEDLGKYKPVMYQEPNGQSSTQHEVPPPELGKYQPIRHNEPDGKPLDNLVERPPPDLKDYAPFRYNEPDGQPITPEEESCDPEDLAKYRPFKYNEPDGQPRSIEEASKYDPEELNKYVPFTHNEPDGMPIGQEEAAPDASELKQYKAFMYNEPDGQPMVATRSAHKDAAELKGYTALRYNEPDGKPAETRDTVADALKEYDTQEGLPYSETACIEEREKLKTLQAKQLQVHEREALEKLRARDIRALFTASPDSRQKLTGNFSRDFPEEFSETWAADQSSHSSLLPKNKLRQNLSKAGLATQDLGFGTSKLQTALDRQSCGNKLSPERHAELMAQADLYSTVPRGLETSYAEECGGKPTWPTYVKTYGSLTAKPLAKPADKSSNNVTEPTVYKILAYDPVMQCINTAETTSVVADHASPLTPAEVLLRLSNPSNFFPHFAPLQAQGFEIISGSGDVLIFRKVRSSASASDTAQASRQGSEAAAASAQTVDSVEGQSSSPYGQEQGGASGPPRASSGVKVRREEPVFSGTRTKQQPRTEKSSITKRAMIGAGWVAGISYAIGVVGEYFRTGGVDGKGPKGL